MSCRCSDAIVRMPQSVSCAKKCEYKPDQKFKRDTERHFSFATRRHKGSGLSRGNPGEDVSASIKTRDTLSFVCICLMAPQSCMCGAIEAR